MSLDSVHTVICTFVAKYAPAFEFLFLFSMILAIFTARDALKAHHYFTFLVYSVASGFCFRGVKELS